ncbi:GDP-mannose 4,6-dehydratase [Candidatus Pelagibacter bacterium]|nr:GDP-mannose 4,6-dehydratase [Candidatus Pelagibacter bacterium]MDB2709175.1 GDP-mannose 4,6-dehydratase [Candidatus Pelagibacter bacterium]
MKKKIALITGITGQDGSILAKLLLQKNYLVHGIKRRSSSFNTQRLDDIYKDLHEPNPDFFLHYGDLTDFPSILNIIQKVQPNEIYNLAAQSHVQVSFETPEYTANADAIGTLRILEAIRVLKLEKKTKFYQASTSEMYGSSPPPQSENTPMHPASPYGAAKLYAHWITKNYRKSYNMFTSTGILFNHEGPSRGETFVSRKITMGIANILKKNQKFLYLGNLDAYRDWGDARDYVIAMWKILQYKKPDDFVIATGKSYSVREFVEIAFSLVGINISWKGKSLNEIGYDNKTNRIYIKIDKKYFRPQEVDHLRGDFKKAKRLLKWEPKIKFKEMIKDMLEKDLSN